MTPGAPVSGIFRGPGNFFSEFSKLEDVFEVIEYVKPGNSIVGPKEGQPTWICEVVVSTHLGPHYALKRVLEISSDIISKFLPFVYTS